jgi:2-methylcitrate dehydratase PrpD
MTSATEELAEWACELRFEDVPGDVIATTKLRILDVIGLAVAGGQTPFGAAVIEAAQGLGGQGPARVFGTDRMLAPAAAAFANGALAQALEYDDTHNESVVHISAPSVSAALALAEGEGSSGRDVLTAIALGSEIACRIGVVSPGQLHKRGFHPTGLFSTFGCAYLAGRLLGLDAPAMGAAAGIAGSFASGLLQCWVDGTQSKFLHPGWAAQSGIAAALLARGGATGPQYILEGRFGLFASHIQDPKIWKDYDRVSHRLGDIWESRNASFKPMPAAHVIHPYVDALLRLKARHGVEPEQVEEIVCPVAAYIVTIVCEPLVEKRHPRSDSHGRVSLPYTLAEALVLGRLGKDAYAPSSLADPRILALAGRIRHEVDPSFPGPERFKGAVRVRLKDGRILSEVEEHNRGSAANPLPPEAILAKFEENASGRLDAGRRKALIDAVMGLDAAHSPGDVNALACSI